MRSNLHFLSAVKRSLGQNGGHADVILVMPLKVCFDPRGGNREQAFQADGVEGTVSISSVWKKRRKRENHRVASFRGELQLTGVLSRKMFN
jgi:hypothetical protein